MNLKELFIKNDNRVEIKVAPNANSDKIKVIEENGCFQVKVYVTVTPEDGKANSKVIKLISKELKIPQSKIKIVKGLKSRSKVINITD